MKKIKDSFKYIKFSDLLAPLLFIIALPFSLILRLVNKWKNRELWLVCEEGKYARDNGYHFFKYIRTEHPDDYCFYVIDKNSKDYEKVKEYNNIIQFKSFKHWVFYLAAKFNISSQKNGNPNQIFFYIIHVVLGLFNNRVFLQHGVIKDMCEWLLYKNTKFRYFICGAKDEYEYVNNNYGYPEGHIQYTGLARFDNLHDYDVDTKLILVIPTWRSWLGRETNSLAGQIDFTETAFFKYWNSFLNNPEFINYIEKKNIKVVFYPHVNMQKYLNCFKVKSENICLADMSVDIQKVLKSAALMITDYSSVFMDFAYMKKPIIYYQFDKEEYRSKQYVEGYFSYEKNGFGPVIENEKKLVNYIIKNYNSYFFTEDLYKKRMDSFFSLYDTRNCERQYKLLRNSKEVK